MMTNEKQEIIRNSVSYKLVHAIALWMDRRLLDPLIGLVLPGFGDALTSVLAVPYLYLSIVKLKSIPLTLAIVCNILLDVLIGIIPYIGVVGDVFKRAFTRNAAMIKGYAGDRPESGRYGFSHRDSLRTYLCHGIGCCKNCGMGWFLFLTKRI